jgi:hypothetical protein
MASQRKTHLGTAAEPCSQFIHLHVRELEGAERVLVQRLSVRALAGQPRGDGRLPEAEDPWSLGRIQPFGNGREHHGDLLGRGFQTVERGMAPGSERGVASRTSKGLDALGLAMLTIPEKPHGCENR